MARWDIGDGDSVLVIKATEDGHVTLVGDVRFTVEEAETARTYLGAAITIAAAADGTRS